MRNRGLRSLCAALAAAVLAAAPAQATDIVRTLPSGKQARADYRPGAGTRPAVLLLHGFLTTAAFNTIYALTNELAADGYTVLAPTLSLGIDKRSATLACDAIHTHTLEGDVAEIDWWVKWLVARGHPRIVLVGHSTGSLESIVYASLAPDPAVKGVVATALISLAQRDPETVRKINRDLAQARERVARNDRRPGRYHVSFCNGNFTAPAAVYLSYVGWSNARIIDAVRRSRVPVRVIVPGRDLEFDANWPNVLAQAGAEVSVVQNASHFFDGEHEFEFHDTVGAVLKTLH